MANKTTITDFKWEQMLCFQVMSIPFQHRCNFTRSVPNCSTIMSLVNYLEFMYCVMGVKTKLGEIVVVVAYLFIIFALMVTISHVVDYYFAPLLKILSLKMKMNEYFAGATLLAFGNTFPDLVANLLPVRAEAPLYTITVSNSMAVILLSGGTVVYLKPFSMNGGCTLRDLLFLVLAGVSLNYLVHSNSMVTRKEALCYSLLYLIFLAVNIVDLVLTRMFIKSLRSNIKALMEQKPSIERKMEINKQESILYNLEKDDKLRIREEFYGIFHSQRPRNSWRPRDQFTNNSSFQEFFGFTTQKPEKPLPTVDFEVTRIILHSDSNPKNLFLFAEFFEDLLPINLEDWRNSGCSRRFFLILKAPLVFCCTIFIPVVDYSLDKHGWSKLLNCTQIITCPIMLSIISHTAFQNIYGGWIMYINFNYALWTLCATVPLAILIFVTTRTDLPPTFHMAFLILSASSAIIIITICAAEMEILCSIVGLVCYLSEDFVTATLRSCTSAIADIVVNINLAMQGYERMAFAAILGGPIFNMILGVSIPCLFNENIHEEGSSRWLTGGIGFNCFIFYMLTIISTIFWTLTFNFYARRSAAIFSFTLYIIFLIFSLLVESDTIHEFGTDQVFHPV